MPALGGPSRIVASGLIAISNGVPGWSPDSKWLLWAQNPPHSLYQFIYAAPAAGGAALALTDPPGSKPMQGHHPAISPDGRQIVWSRCEQGNCELFVTGFQDGRATGTLRQLTHDHKTKRTPQWTSDGKEIVYLAVNP